MMHDAVVERIHPAGHAKERGQQHDCHKMEQCIACRVISHDLSCI